MSKLFPSKDAKVVKYRGYEIIESPYEKGYTVSDGFFDLKTCRTMTKAKRFINGREKRNSKRKFGYWK